MTAGEHLVALAGTGGVALDLFSALSLSPPTSASIAAATVAAIKAEANLQITWLTPDGIAKAGPRYQFSSK